MEAMLLNLLVGAGFGVIILLIGFITSKFLKPWIDAKQSRKDFAQELLIVSEDIITEVQNSEFGQSITYDEKIDAIIERVAKSLGVDLNASPNKAEAIKRVVTNKVSK